MSVLSVHNFEYDVHIFDTDCYGVVWHGAYTKWLEMGRVDYMKARGITLLAMSDEYDIIFPVVEQTLKYKASAKQGQTLTVTTALEIAMPKLLFTQTIANKDSGKCYLQALTTVVLINRSGRVYKQLPKVLEQVF